MNLFNILFENLDIVDLNEGGIDVKLQYEDVVIDLCELLEDDVDIESIFPKEKYKH